MSFGLEMCTWMVTKRGKVVRTEGIVLPEGNTADIEDSYLGIPQANGTHEEAARKATTTKYMQRVRCSEESAEQEEQDLGYQQLCSNGHQIPFWDHQLAKGGDRRH